MSERREILLTLKACLVDALTGAPAREVAAVSRELRATLAELDSLPPAADGPLAPVDEIAKQREERRRKAAGE